MLGDCESGKTLARDGASEIHDFNELGNEWQVLQADDMLFHDRQGRALVSKSLHFARGSLRPTSKRLGEASISVEEAENLRPTMDNLLQRI